MLMLLLTRKGTSLVKQQFTGIVSEIRKQNNDQITALISDVDCIIENYICFKGFIVNRKSLSVGTEVFVEGYWSRNKLRGPKFKGLICQNNSRDIKALQTYKRPSKLKRLPKVSSATRATTSVKI
jgi:hypothetical protein